MDCCVNWKTVFDIIPYISHSCHQNQVPHLGALQSLYYKITSGNLSLWSWSRSHKFSICWHNSSVTSNTTETWNATRNPKRHTPASFSWRKAQLTGPRFWEHPIWATLLSSVPACRPPFPSARDTHWEDATLCLPAIPLKWMGCRPVPVLLSYSAGPLHLEHWEPVKQLKGKDLFPSFQLLFCMPIPSSYFPESSWEHPLSAEYSTRVTSPCQRRSCLPLKSTVKFTATEKHTLETSSNQQYNPHLKEKRGRKEPQFSLTYFRKFNWNPWVNLKTFPTDIILILT